MSTNSKLVSSVPYKLFGSKSIEITSNTKRARGPVFFPSSGSSIKGLAASVQTHTLFRLPTGKTSLIPTMRFIAVSLLAVATAAQRPSPSWYVDKGIENKKQCEQTKALTTNGPIYIDTAKSNKVTGDKQKICIYFPPARITIPDKKNPGKNKTVNLGGWRHDEGELSHCANQCCEWDPPVSKIGKKPPPPTWFETVDGCDAVPEETITGPLLIRGILWEPKSICIQNKEGEFVKRLGHLRNCGFKCCTFTPPRPPPPQGPPPLPLPRNQVPSRRDYNFFPVPEVVEVVEDTELEE